LIAFERRVREEMSGRFLFTAIPWSLHAVPRMSFDAGERFNNERALVGTV
jgi:hypothetical protein